MAELMLRGGVQQHSNAALLLAFAAIVRTSVRENTLASFLNAYRNGASWVELDVRLSRDGIFVVSHAEQARVWRGRQPVEVAINETTAQELSRWGIPTLAQVHASLPRGLGFLIEMKVSGSQTPTATTETLVAFLQMTEYVKDLARQRPVQVISFDTHLFDLSYTPGWPRGVQRGILTTTSECPTMPLAIDKAREMGADLVCVPANVMKTVVDPDNLDVTNRRVEEVKSALAPTAARSRLGLMIWDAKPERGPDLALAIKLGAQFFCTNGVDQLPPGMKATWPSAGADLARGAIRKAGELRPGLRKQLTRPTR